MAISHRRNFDLAVCLIIHFSGVKINFHAFNLTDHFYFSLFAKVLDIQLLDFL